MKKTWIIMVFSLIAGVVMTTRKMHDHALVFNKAEGILIITSGVIFLITVTVGIIILKMRR